MIMEIERFEIFAIEEIKRRTRCRVNKKDPCGPDFTRPACIECMNRHYQNLVDQEARETTDG